MATVAPLFSMLQPLPPVGRLLIYLPQRTIVQSPSPTMSDQLPLQKFNFRRSSYGMKFGIMVCCKAVSK